MTAVPVPPLHFVHLILYPSAYVAELLGEPFASTPNVMVALLLSDSKTRIPETGLSNPHSKLETMGSGAFTRKFVLNLLMPPIVQVSPLIRVSPALAKVTLLLIYMFFRAAHQLTVILLSNATVAFTRTL